VSNSINQTPIPINQTPIRSVEGRSHIFDVVKVNMFGVRQSRLLVVEHPEPGTNVRRRRPAARRRRQPVVVVAPFRRLAPPGI